MLPQAAAVHAASRGRRAGRHKSSVAALLVDGKVDRARHAHDRRLAERQHLVVKPRDRALRRGIHEDSREPFRLLVASSSRHHDVIKTTRRFVLPVQSLSG